MSGFIIVRISCRVDCFKQYFSTLRIYSKYINNLIYRYSQLAEVPFKCYVTLFSGNLIATHPLVMLITLNHTVTIHLCHYFFGKFEALPPPTALLNT